jgi:hypothetical protein
MIHTDVDIFVLSHTGPLRGELEIRNLEECLLQDQIVIHLLIHAKERRITSLTPITGQDSHARAYANLNLQSTRLKCSVEVIYIPENS